MLIIGFGHKARQGKNTAAIAMLNAMALSLVTHARVYAYADALRAEVNRAISDAGGLKELLARGWVKGHCTAKACQVHFPAWVVSEQGKPRTLLQWWGTEYRRAQATNYWVYRLQETLDREQPEAALITDVRFPNEVDAIHARGGVVVKVTKTTKPDVSVPPHPSEQALDGYTGWDYELTAATLPELRKKAAALYLKIARKA